MNIHSFAQSFICYWYFQIAGYLSFCFKFVMISKFSSHFVGQIDFLSSLSVFISSYGHFAKLIYWSFASLRRRRGCLASRRLSPAHLRRLLPAPLPPSLLTLPPLPLPPPPGLEVFSPVSFDEQPKGHPTTTTNRKTTTVTTIITTTITTIITKNAQSLNAQVYERGAI